MNRMIGFVGMTAGSWAGWWLGARLSSATALWLSLVGSGVGLYLARRWAHENL